MGHNYLQYFCPALPWPSAENSDTKCCPCNVVRICYCVFWFYHHTSFIVTAVQMTLKSVYIFLHFQDHRVSKPKLWYKCMFLGHTVIEMWIFGSLCFHSLLTHTYRRFDSAALQKVEKLWYVSINQVESEVPNICSWWVSISFLINLKTRRDEALTFLSERKAINIGVLRRFNMKLVHFYQRTNSP